MKLGIVGTGLIVDTLFQFIEEIDNIEITALCGTAHSKDKIELLSDFPLVLVYKLCLLDNGTGSINLR